MDKLTAGGFRGFTRSLVYYHLDGDSEYQWLLDRILDLDKQNNLVDTEIAYVKRNGKEYEVLIDNKKNTENYHKVRNLCKKDHNYLFRDLTLTENQKN